MAKNEASDNGNKRVMMAIWMTANDKASIERIAADQDRSMSSCIRQMIRREIAAHDKRSDKINEKNSHRKT